MDLYLRATAVNEATASSGHGSSFAESATVANEATASSSLGSRF
jgi:hypothetical protein